MANSEDTLLKVLMTITSIVLYTIWGLIWAIPLKFGWNYVMPSIFNLPMITYWQMFWLYVVLMSLIEPKISVVRKND